jgi:hypothetical protein
MDAKRVRRARGGDQGGRHGRAAGDGLQVRERGGWWYVVGTVRVVAADGRRRGRRIRKSTGLQATPDNRPDAESLRSAWETQVRNEAVHGIRASVPLAVAAAAYLDRGKPTGGREAAVLQEIEARFGKRVLSSIDETEWHAFVAQRNAGNAASTRERYLNALLAILTWFAKKPRYWMSVPEFERDQEARKPRHRHRRRVAEWRPELIALLIDNAGWHLKPQLAVEWSTGGRVSSVLHGCRLCDLILAEGREQITFHDTKNGDPVNAALHPYAARAVRVYLKRRGRLEDREGPLFLDHHNQPYTKGTGTNRKAFNNAKARTIAALRRRAVAEAVELRRNGAREVARDIISQAWTDMRLVRLVTQHWFRHLLATTMLAMGQLRTAMDQAGWRDVHSVMAYAHDVPDHRRRIVGDLPIGDQAADPRRRRSEDK